MEVGLDPVDNNFGNQFVGGIAQSNRPVTFYGGCISAFRYEAKQGRIFIRGHGATFEDLFAEDSGFVPTVPQNF